jgi:hypothetical protein
MSVPATVTIKLEMETAKAILRYFSTNDAALTNEQMFNAQSSFIQALQRAREEEWGDQGANRDTTDFLGESYLSA